MLLLLQRHMRLVMPTTFTILFSGSKPCRIIGNIVDCCRTNHLKEHSLGVPHLRPASRFSIPRESCHIPNEDGDEPISSYAFGKERLYSYQSVIAENVTRPGLLRITKSVAQSQMLKLSE